MKKTRDPVFVPAMLRKLQEGAHTTGELLDVFCSGYGESYRKARRIIYGTGMSRKSGKDWGDVYIEAQRFYNLLNYLKRQGLVEKKESKMGRTCWSITARGRKNVRDWQDKKQERYEIKKDTVLRVVVFDIPETEKAKRDWLRGALRRLGFSLLQESVWIGLCKLPERFLLDLKRQGLLPCVHIFEVREEGTIPTVSG
ncbi:MAG: hypothetical protein AAB601_01905 [Patescibacteria group bacterium]